MEFSEADILWSIAATDESERYSHPAPGTKTLSSPTKRKVTQTDPVQVASYDSEGRPDLDENARSTFHSASPEDYLFRDREEAWETFLEKKKETAEKKMKKIQDTIARAEITQRLVEAGWDSEGLYMVWNMKTDPERVAEVTDNSLPDE